MKIPLEKKSPRITVQLTENNKGIIFVELHEGEETFSESMWLNIERLLEHGWYLILMGDNLNADDLYGRGIVSKDNIFYQMQQFNLRFAKYRKQVLLMINAGHEWTRIMSKRLSRQTGATLEEIWGNIIAKFKKEGTKIADYVCELKIKTPTKNYKCLILHPVGYSSVNAFIYKLQREYISVGEYDYVFIGHFHRRADREAIAKAWGNKLGITQLIFVPVMIEKPKYYDTKSIPSSHVGFLTVWYGRDRVDKIIKKKPHLMYSYKQKWVH